MGSQRKGLKMVKNSYIAFGTSKLTDKTKIKMLRKTLTLKEVVWACS